MKANFDAEKKLFIVEKDGGTVALTAEEIIELEKLACKKIFYVEDVQGFLQDRYDSGDDEEKLLFGTLMNNAEFISDFVDAYAEYREEGDYNWEDCLLNAFHDDMEDRLDDYLD